jgi:hypothetical protein
MPQKLDRADKAVRVFLIIVAVVIGGLVLLQLSILLFWLIGGD